VARYVRARDAGQLQTTPAQRNQVIDPFRKYIEGWVDDSHGRVRADVVQDKLEALGLGYVGSERTVRRAVAEAKAAYRAGHRRRFRPWLPEPGLWFQWDYTDGPRVDGRDPLPRGGGDDANAVADVLSDEKEALLQQLRQCASDGALNARLEEA